MGNQPHNKRSAPRGADDHVWDSLREIHKSMAEYTAVPRILAPLMRDRPLLELVQQKGNLDVLVQQADLLSRDVSRFTNDLSDIYASHSTRRGSSSAADDPMRSVRIFERYQEWAVSYERVVVPTIIEIVRIFNQAGGQVALPGAQSGAVIASLHAMAQSQNPGN